MPTTASSCRSTPTSSCAGSPHPEEDPDVLAKGRAVSMLGATHRLRIGKEEADGHDRARLCEARRGPLPRPADDRRPRRRARHARRGAAAACSSRTASTTCRCVDEGDHLLEIEFRAPVVRHANGRRVAFRHPAVRRHAVLDVACRRLRRRAARSVGAGAVIARPSTSTRPARTGACTSAAAPTWTSRSWSRGGAEPEVALRTRVESRVVHSIRDGGTESRAWITLHVLQGKADPPGRGPARGRLRPAGRRSRDRPVGDHRRPPATRVRPAPGGGGRGPARGLARDGRPDAPRGAAGARRAGHDRGARRHRGQRRSVPAGRADGRPTGSLRTATPARRGRPRAGQGGPRRRRLALRHAAHALRRERRGGARGPRDRHPRGRRLRRRPRAEPLRRRRSAWTRACPSATWCSTCPATTRCAPSPGRRVAAWWTEGDGRRAHAARSPVRPAPGRPARSSPGSSVASAAGATPSPCRAGASTGAKRDRGEVQLFALTDVDPDPGRLPGLRSDARSCQRAAVRGRPCRTPRSCAPSPGRSRPRTRCPVTLRTPPLEAEAVVVTSVHPGDESHRLEHLVLFDVRRGLTDQFDVFVPDGGMSAARRRAHARPAARSARARSSDADPTASRSSGTLYEIHVQSARSGIVEIMIVADPAPGPPGARREAGARRRRGRRRARREGRAVVRPRTHLPRRRDGACDRWGSRRTGRVGRPAVPARRASRSGRAGSSTPRARRTCSPSRRSGGSSRSSPVRSSASAQADIVLGRDGQARVRVRYRLFNRRRQFLRVHAARPGRALRRHRRRSPREAARRVRRGSS